MERDKIKCSIECGEMKPLFHCMDQNSEPSYFFQIESKEKK